MNESLIEAQMHLECIAEIFHEMESGEPPEEDRDVIWAELTARVWAAIYLVQRVNMGTQPPNFREVIAEARHFGGEGSSAGTH